MKLKRRNRVKRKNYFDFSSVTSEERVAIKNASLSARVLINFIGRKVPFCGHYDKALALIDEALQQINCAICFHGIKNPQRILPKPSPTFLK